MRKLFFFKSSASSSGNNNPVSPPPNSEAVYWEAPWVGCVDTQVTDKVQDSSRSPKGLVSRSGRQFPESQNSTRSGLRRSHSFSSPIICSDLAERNLNCSSDLSRSPNSGSVLCHMDDFTVCCRSLTPERYPKPKRGDPAAARKMCIVDKLDSPSSSRSYFESSGNSPYGSPVPLKCRSARLTQLPNTTLDLYIDGEQHERRLRPKPESRRCTLTVGNGYLAENRNLRNSRRPPRVQSTAPTSPTNGKEQLRSYSFREARDTQLRVSSRDWRMDDIGPISPQKLTKNGVERPSHVFPRKQKMELRDFDSKSIMTVEDIYEDYSESHPAPQSKGIMQTGSSSEHVSLCHPSDPPCEPANGHFTKEISGFQKQRYFVGEYPAGAKHECSIYSVEKEEAIDVELHRKAKEAEERVILLSEDIDQVNLQNGSFSISALLQMIRDITNDRRNLALEVSSQIQSRIAERASLSEVVKCAQVDLETQTRRLEKEKNELQLHLEKELDRRSSDWSLKIEKCQSEEQRLRERVRELAEQNVSLQREVSSFNNKEVEIRNRVMHLDMQLNEVTARMDEARAENCNLQETLSQLQEHCKGVEMDRDCIKRSYNEKVKESKELQKAVARLQRICGEQDKTISGLRQGLIDDISEQSTQKGDLVIKLQMEQVRLTGVEQMLRREVESCRHEVESLRHENINLLGRLQGAGNGPLSAIKLDQELCARVNVLQNHCLSLLDDHGQLERKLLEFVKNIMCHIPKNPSSEWAQEIHNGFDGYLIIEYEMRLERFLKGVENLRRSLQTTSSILQEKTNLDASDCQLNINDGGILGHSKDQALEVNAEVELKAEILLTKALREKLCFKEMELEQLQAELATSIRGLDILRCELQSAHDTVSCLTHKMKDLELQALRKDENVNQLQSDLQECMKELTITRSILPKVSAERDLMWEEVKQYSEKNMLLNCELISLKKKIEALDEDILLKEGQITILKDSLGSKPFDLLYSPTTTMKELSLE
ncbi:uncharacterized protein LOC131251143 [Magnolia sinica]|uniref:uncharacterized protein LOC131251143 n=1 Tax=Magnolia sinica TaxID=86752 RepID=UPI0026588F63|nr:uncharacterized protein LOC131251143 [Magnolia sinica]XP_058107660.1 uncharacterized protein LOC131251143 [Magnolia sinica]